MPGIDEDLYSEEASNTAGESVDWYSYLSSLLLFSQNNKYHNSAFLGTDILKKILALVNEEAGISIFITALFVEAMSL